MIKAAREAELDEATGGAPDTAAGGGRNESPVVMTAWTRITGEASLLRFLETVDYFHDAAVREVALVAREYVGADLSFYNYAQPADGTVVVHSQNPESPLIELRCRGIRRLAWAAGCELEGSGEVGRTGVTLYLGPRSSNAAIVITAEEISYRIGGPEAVGPSYRAVRPDLLDWLTDADGCA
jgi:hypothetical protein